MRTTRALLATVIVTVLVVGPALFMASSPCLDCDGVCGAATTVSVVRVPTDLLALPLDFDARTPVASVPLHPSELPPRPLLATV